MAIVRLQFNLNGGSSILRCLPMPIHSLEKPWPFVRPSQSLLTHRPGSIPALPGDRMMPSETGLCPDYFYA